MISRIDRLSLFETAQVLKTTELNVLMHIKCGLLEGSERDGDWNVSGESLIIFMARRGGNRQQVVSGSGCSSAGGCGGSCS